MTAPSPVIEAFSLTHAQILDGSTSFRAALADYRNNIAGDEDFYGVSDSSLEPNTDTYQNEGDDRVLSRWNWFNFAELTVTAGYLSFPVISNLTGVPLVSSGSGAATSYEIDFWTEAAMNVANRPMMLVSPAKDHRGKPSRLVIGLYNVSFGAMTFDGPRYKDGLKINYNGTALMSDYDELGNPFPAAGAGQVEQGARAARLLSVL